MLRKPSSEESSMTYDSYSACPWSLSVSAALSGTFSVGLTGAVLAAVTVGLVALAAGAS